MDIHGCVHLSEIGITGLDDLLGGEMRVQWLQVTEDPLDDRILGRIGGSFY